VNHSVAKSSNFKDCVRIYREVWTAMLEYEWAVGRDCLEPGSRVQEARQAAARGPSNSNYQQRAAVLASSMLLQSSCSSL
jgi:hypothetical protein